MITIKNTQRKITINVTQLKKNIAKILTHLEYEDYDLGLWITTNQTIRKFNKKYRDKNKATGVLSFAYHPLLKPEERINPLSEADKNLGDIIISPEFIKKEAPTWDQTFQKRLTETIVHGICHLLGHSHKEDTQFEKMQKKEAELLKII
jgi:probable rRNA maturation factor